MNVNIFENFVSKTGSVYHFAILAINEKLESYPVGFILVNSQMNNTYWEITSHLLNTSDFDINQMVENVKLIVAKMEEVIFIQ